MTALGCYMAACRFVMRCNAWNESDEAQLTDHLLALRQALACCVCGQIVLRPRSSATSQCHHNVCSDCINGKMKFKPPCACSKNRDNFVENAQVRILVQCFKTLCQYVMSSVVASNLKGVNCAANSLQVVLQEGSGTVDVYSLSHCDAVSPSRCESVHTSDRPVTAGRKRRRKRRFSNKIKSSSVPTSGSGDYLKEAFVSRHKIVVDCAGDAGVSDTTVGESLRISNEDLKIKLDKSVHSNAAAQVGMLSLFPASLSGDCLQPNHVDILLTDESQLAHGSFNTVTSEHDYTSREPCETSEQSIMEENLTKPLPINNLRKKENTNSNILKFSKGKVSLLSDMTTKCSQEQTETSSCGPGKQKPAKIQRKGSGCRCGLATPNPGKLTCCGQRCPCYSAFRGCVDCRCRGCRNPRGDPSKITPLLQPLVQLQEKDDLESDVEIDI